MEPWLARAARMHPERVALEAPERTWTYAALSDAARAAGRALSDRGVRAGDAVALALASEPLIVALHGCLSIGAAAVPIDLRLGDAERAPRLRGAALVVDEPLHATSRSPGPSSQPGPPMPLSLDAVASVMYTSGTTAEPKRVELTVGNWLWNAIGSATALGLDPAERWLCPMPLAHVGGLSIALRSAIYGTTVVLHERFDTAAALAALEQSDPARAVTLVSLVPTMLSRLLDAGLHEPPALRRVLLGGGPIAPALLERARVAGVAVSPSFGMTETCSQIATDGYPLLGAELAIGAGEELLVRGPSVAAGALAHDGWLHTGDRGALDGSGRLSIIGRIAETIVSGGENVAPTEVEAALVEHPGVADAAVLGRPDPEWGEAVVALVVPAPGAAVASASASASASVAEAELRAWCAARLAPFKVPRRVELVASVPRGPTGKLLRRELR